MIYINNKEKIENLKLDKNNFFVVADFDQTLTEGKAQSTWQVTAGSEHLGDEYIKRRDELYNYYRPKEIDPNIPDNEKCKLMNKWWKQHIDLFFEYGLNRAMINESIQQCNLKYRKGAKEFLQKMNEYDIPVIIISAGIGNVIENFLKIQNDYYNNIKIVSNFINFENEEMKGLHGEIIHALNKNIVNLDDTSKSVLSNKDKILLLGDGLADLKMISENDKNRAITVGFLEENIDENLDIFNKNFDIVITNEGTFEDVNNILKIY